MDAFPNTTVVTHNLDTFALSTVVDVAALTAEYEALVAHNRKTWKASRVDKLWVTSRTRSGHKKVLVWRDAYDAEKAFLARLAMLSSLDPQVTGLKARVWSRYGLDSEVRDALARSIARDVLDQTAAGPTPTRGQNGSTAPQISEALGQKIKHEKRSERPNRPLAFQTPVEQDATMTKRVPQRRRKGWSPWSLEKMTVGFQPEIKARLKALAGKSGMARFTREAVSAELDRCDRAEERGLDVGLADVGSVSAFIRLAVLREVERRESGQARPHTTIQ